MGHSVRYGFFFVLVTQSRVNIFNEFMMHELELVHVEAKNGSDILKID